MQTAELHIPTVSGLWSHSHDAASDLMKHYVVFKALPSGGNLGMASYDTQEAAQAAQTTVAQFAVKTRLYDNFADVWIN
jgi:hypothetical protein